MTRARSKMLTPKLRGYWCSAFNAYILPGRCGAEKRFARGECAMTKRARPGTRGRKVLEVSREEKYDFEAAIRQRSPCLSCPGVVRRSLRRASSAS